MMDQKYHHSTLFKHLFSRMRRRPRGQAFVELIFVLTFLMLLLAGMVEFGFLLNNYLHVLDGSREGARYSSSANSFLLDSSGVSIASYYDPPFYYQAAWKTADTLNPVTLNPTYPDDIVVSVFSLDGTTPTRYPATDPNGWSLCAHYNTNADDTSVDIKDSNGVDHYPYSSFKQYWPDIGAAVPSSLPTATWGAGCTVRASQFTVANVTSLLGGVALVPGDTNPPKTGVVVVEVYYNYPQLLKLPVLENVLPDPIPLYVYSVMPLSSAQPTQVPNP